MDMISKVGMWQRYKTENLTEVYKLIGKFKKFYKIFCSMVFPCTIF